MLYKVTPMLPPEPKKAKRTSADGALPRKKRKSSIYDAEGNEVLITLMCLKCKKMKPLMQFGLRKMADGAIRNQPWCRGCRSTAGTPKQKAEATAEIAVPTEVVAVAAVAPSTPTLTVVSAPIETPAAPAPGDPHIG